MWRKKERAKGRGQDFLECLVYERQIVVRVREKKCEEQLKKQYRIRRK